MESQIPRKVLISRKYGRWKSVTSSEKHDRIKIKDKYFNFNVFCWNINLLGLFKNIKLFCNLLCPIKLKKKRKVCRFIFNKNYNTRTWHILISCVVGDFTNTNETKTKNTHIHYDCVDTTQWITKCHVWIEPTTFIAAEGRLLILLCILYSYWLEWSNKDHDFYFELWMIWLNHK